MSDPAVHAVPTPAPVPQPAAGQRLLHLEGVTKVFLTDEVETHALSNVHMTVHQGEWVAIVGPSGSGKTTLLAILGLLDTPTSGNYLLDGRPVSGLTGASTSLASSAAASSSAWRWPGQWPVTRCSSSPTSPPETSTPRTARR